MAFTVPLIQSIKRSEELQIDINRSLRMFTLSNEAIITATDELIAAPVHLQGHLRGRKISFCMDRIYGTERKTAPASRCPGGVQGNRPRSPSNQLGRFRTGDQLRSIRQSGQANPPSATIPLKTPPMRFGARKLKNSAITLMISLPLASDNQSFGVLNIYSDKPDSFTLSEVKLLQEMTDDLVYGIKALQGKGRAQADRGGACEE